MTVNRKREQRLLMSGEGAILVTGGAGFIGSNFVLEWLKEERGPLVNLDALTYAGKTPRNHSSPSPKLSRARRFRCSLAVIRQSLVSRKVAALSEAVRTKKKSVPEQASRWL